MTRIILAALISLTLASKGAAQLLARKGYSTIALGQIQLTITQDGPDPLPFQPVRFRTTFQNKSNEALRPGIPPVLHHMRLFEVKSPTDADFREAPLVGYVTGSPPTIIASFVRIPRPIAIPGAGRADSTFALMAHWEIENAPLKPEPDVIPRPLFPVSGKYSLKFYYPTERAGYKVTPSTIVVTVPVNVREPDEKDKAIIAMLEKDASLFGAMMNPIWVTAKRSHRPQLEAILRDYPDSSYAPYARLALARYYLRGDQERKDGLSERMRMAKAADEAEKLLQVNFAHRPKAALLLIEADPNYGRHHKEGFIAEYWDAIEWRQTIGADRLSNPESRPKLPQPESDSGKKP